MTDVPQRTPLYPDEPEKDRCYCVDCGVELPRGCREVFTACDACWDRAHAGNKQNVMKIEISAELCRRVLSGQYGAMVELKLLIRQKYTQSLEDVHGAGQQQNENPGGGD